MTALEWLAWVALLIVALAAGAAVTLSNGAVTRAIRRLERTYRRQKSLELEQLQAQAVARRRAEVEEILAQPGGWQQVLDQLLADALPEVGARVGPEGVLKVSAAPAPHFVVAGEKGLAYTFTTSPDALRKAGVFGRKNPVVPLDASLHPATRAEAQAVWDHLATRHVRQESIPVLPRQAGWFLVVCQAPAPKAARRAPGLPGRQRRRG
ncbi:MAG TPA: hypothetical protein ENI39_04630 [Anaerolineae bacterium]|nr:hypothetical protein [Anaerolineae bacterium]